MLVLALDSATPLVTAGVVDLPADQGQPVVTRSVRVAEAPRKHAELLMPGVLAACAEAGVALAELAAVVVGVGPGPFTGLRVGVVTAAAIGDAIGIPVYGVCSLDAIAADARAAVTGPFLVATDARRREVYWAAYDAAGVRTSGPAVEAPAQLVARLGELAVVAAAGECAPLLGLPTVEPTMPTPAGLVAVAATDVRSGAVPLPLEPLYLRRPDAQVPTGRKRVSGPTQRRVRS